MAKKDSWSDEYWLPLIQVFLKKPVGVKPTYSKPLVELAMELHIAPQFLYEQMFKLRQLETPRMEELWNHYGKNPKKLKRALELWRQKEGYGHADAFYQGVEINETWEKDFKPLEKEKSLMPVGLILILDLYFRLTPNTMVEETPEIIELAKKMKIKPSMIVEIMEIYQVCDPYLKKNDSISSPLSTPCREIWERFGNKNPEKLAALAAQMKQFFD